MSQDYLTMPNGAKYLPAVSEDSVFCMSCYNEVDTPEEVATYPAGNCPQCNNPWTGTEPKSTRIMVTMPVALGGETM